MSTRSLIHQTKLKEWASIIKTQKSSGLSIVEWCHHNTISRDKFFYRKRLLKEEALEQALPDIISLSIPSVLPQSELIPTTPTVECGNCTSCTTFTPTSNARVLINGITIEINSSASEAFIYNLIKAVKHA